MKIEYKKLPVNNAEPNWMFAANGIRCRVDRIGASVYFFKKSPAGPVTILAHSLNDAVDTLNSLEEANDCEDVNESHMQETFA